MRSLSLIPAVVFACVVEFAQPHYPLLDDLLSDYDDTTSSASSSHAEPAIPQIEAATSLDDDESIGAPLTAINVQRNLKQGEDNNVFRRSMGAGANGDQQQGVNRRRMSSNGKGMGKGGMMMSNGKAGMMMSPTGKGRMSPNRNPAPIPPLPPGKGKGSDSGGCWITIGGDGWGGGSSKSMKGSKSPWWNWASMWGPHKVWDPQCRVPCYDHSSSKSKSKKAKAKGKGKGGGSSSKSGPHCPPFKPTPIIPMPSAPTGMMMVPTRMPSNRNPTRRPTPLTRAPAPSTRRPTLAPTAETVAPVPTVTNRTNTTTLAPVLSNRTNTTSAPARR